MTILRWRRSGSAQHAWSIAAGCAAGLLLVLATHPFAQQNFDSVEIKTEKVGEHLFMLRGAGGNIGVFTGEDATLLIDDQFAPLTPKIKAAVAAITDKPVKFLLNTHWHGDHVGGNENFGKDGVAIVAHDNVRKRLEVDQILKDDKGGLDTTLALPHAALPVLTFANDVTFHLNGEDVHIFHVDNAHTDGDAIVHFRKANVLHMGDCYFNGFYPFIDLRSGGSVDGYIAAVEKVLAMMDDKTRLFPGHGALSDRAGLRAFHDRLVGCRDRVAKEVQAGKTLEQVIAAKPTAAYDAQWGGSKFITPERFTTTLYNDRAAKSSTVQRK